ncbi:hypothetical protein M404DRAFT_1007217, partial [Pisolithus tinctorius Marx 270]
PIEDLCWSTYDAGVLHFATHIPSRSTSSHHIPLLRLNHRFDHFKLDRLNAINHRGTLSGYRMVIY